MCFVFCDLCFVFCVLCFVFCVLCFVFYVLCFVFCVLSERESMWVLGVNCVSAIWLQESVDVCLSGHLCVAVFCVCV